MASRGVPLRLHYVAWNNATGQGQTGDALHHTLRWLKDGVAAAPQQAGTIVEADATYLKGTYTVDLTASETDAAVGLLGGISSTANVVIWPTAISFETLPTQPPGQPLGLPVLSSGGKNVSVLDLTQLRTSAVQGTVGESLAGAASRLGAVELDRANNLFKIYDTNGTLLKALPMTVDPDHPTQILRLG